MLAACGGKEGETVVTLWEQMDPEEREIQAEHLRRVMEEIPGLRIQVSHYSTEDLRTQFQTAALGGGGPDLVFGPSDQVGPFSVMGIIHPLDGLVDPGFLGRFRPEALDTLDGHVWALPDQLGNHLMLVWNRDLLERAPETWSELIEMARGVMTDEDGDGKPDRYGLVFNVMEPFWTIPFLTAFGGWVMDAQQRPTLDTPAMVKALRFLRDLRERHGIMPRESDYELADTMFKEGRAAMILNGPWSWEGYRKAGIRIGLARIPRMDETGLWAAPMVSSKGYSINKRVQGERLQLVLRILEALTRPEFQLDFSTRLGTLPTRKEAYESPRLRDDSVLQASLSQIQVGRRMPVVPEMRAIWDVMRPAVQSVWNGTMSPEEAARWMQEQAVRKIAEMKG
jgi:maltose-binding protein MalE